MLNHSAIFLTFLKLLFDIKIFVLSSFEWPFYTGFAVNQLFFRPFTTFGVLLSLAVYIVNAQGSLALSVRHEPFSLFRLCVFIRLDCFSVIIHCLRKPLCEINNFCVLTTESMAKIWIPVKMHLLLLPPLVA